MCLYPPGVCAPPLTCPIAESPIWDSHFTEPEPVCLRASSASWTACQQTDLPYVLAHVVSYLCISLEGEAQPGAARPVVVQGCVHKLLISAWTQTWVRYTGLRRDFPKGQKEGWLLTPWACPGSEVLTSFGCVHVVGQLLV